jgi:hypothetical protein
MRFHVGYEIGTGQPADAELHHLAIFGLTQKSGKTTSLEAFIDRIDGNFSVLVFRTGRGEIGFSKATRIPFYFRERTDWRFVEGIISAHLLEKNKILRANIMRACQGSMTLGEVWKRVREMRETARNSFNQSIYIQLDQYLSEIVPAIKEIKFSESLQLQPGKVHVMDLEKLKRSMQQLIISASVDKILDDFRNVIVVLPEARDFIPEDRGTPTKLSVDTFIRKGAKLGDFIWMDSQALTGLDMDIMRNVGVWMFGRQDLDIEVERCLKNIPGKTVKASDITSLKIGNFWLKQGEDVKKVYVQPTWIGDTEAISIAKGLEDIQERPKESDFEVDEKLREENEGLKATIREFRKVDQDNANEIKRLNHIIDSQSKVLGQRNMELEELKNWIPGGIDESKLKEQLKIESAHPTEIDLTNREVKVNIRNEEPDVRSYSTKSTNGKIIYVLVNDIQGNSGTFQDIQDAMKERGWNVLNNTLAPELGKLVKIGTLLKTGEKPEKYRLPGKLKVEVDKI